MVPVLVLYFGLKGSVGCGTEVVWHPNESETADGVGPGGKVGGQEALEGKGSG